jgi:YT521-B-like domain
VYLIFSVNKSGEFFGYARMVSEIQANSEGETARGPEKNSEEKASGSPAVVLAGPKTTVTPRTNVAPRGKIFEDEIRGTVFWEVASSDDEDIGEGEQVKDDNTWGNPFHIDWIKWYAQLFSI